MALTFAQAKTRIASGIQRDDLLPLLGEFINEALREIQNRRNFLCMKKTVVPVTISASVVETTAALPADFKCLQRRTPVYFINTDGSYIPAFVKSEAQRIRQQSWYMPIVYSYTSPGIAFGGGWNWPPPVFMEIGATGAVLGAVQPVTQDTNYRVDYYAYLPDLVNDTDTSPFLTNYPKMVLAKAKSIAFTDINDPIAVNFEEEFEKKFAEAARAESHAEVAGRELRM